MDGDIRNKVKKLLDSPALRVKAMPVDDNPKEPRLNRDDHSVANEEPKEEPKEVVNKKIKVGDINKIFKELYDTIHDIHNKIPKKDLIKAAAQEIVEMFNSSKLRKNYKLPYKALLISNASDKQSKKAMKYDPFRANIVIKKVLPNLTPEHSQALRSVMKDIPNMPFVNLFSKEEPNKEIPMVARETPQDAKGGADTGVASNGGITIVDDTPKNKIKQIQEIVKENPGKAPHMIPAKQTKEEDKEEAKADKPPVDIDYDSLLSKNKKDIDRLSTVINITEDIKESIAEGSPLKIITSKGSYIIPPNIVKENYNEDFISDTYGEPSKKKLIRTLNTMIIKKYGNIPLPTFFPSTYDIWDPKVFDEKLPKKFRRKSSRRAAKHDEQVATKKVLDEEEENPFNEPLPPYNPELKIAPQQYIHRVYKV